MHFSMAGSSSRRDLEHNAPHSSLDFYVDVQRIVFRAGGTRGRRCRGHAQRHEQEPGSMMEGEEQEEVFSTGRLLLVSLSVAPAPPAPRSSSTEHDTLDVNVEVK
ncbi:unnamed protein product [Lota lota]